MSCVTEGDYFMDYTEQLVELQRGINELISVTAEIEGVLIFFAVVVVAYFSYKFFRIFF